MTMPRLKNDVMVMLAMGIYSFGNVYYKWSKLQMGSLPLNAWQVFIGAITMLPFAILFNGSSVPRITPLLIGSLAWSVIAVSIVANLLWFWLLRKDPLRASMWLFLNPVSGYVLSWLVLGEPIRPTDVIGLLLVMASLVISGVIDVKRILPMQSTQRMQADKRMSQ